MDSDTFPEPPSQAINWSSLGSQSIEFPTSHVECTYCPTTGSWGPPTVINNPNLQINGFAVGVNYGGPYYESLTAQRTRDNRILLFRPLDHARHLADATVAVGMTAIPEHLFLACVRKAVAINTSYVPPPQTDAVLYIRPLLFGPSFPRMRDSPPQYTFCVFARPGVVYPRTAAQNAIVLSDIAAHNVSTTMEGQKCSRNGIWDDGWKNGLEVTAQTDDQQAQRDVYTMKLRLEYSRHGTFINGFTTSAFLGVQEEHGRYTLMVPRHPSRSIISNTCVAIAIGLGWKVKAGPIPVDDIDTLSEVIATSTWHLLLPIRLIFCPSAKQTVAYQAGSQHAGPACRLLRNAMAKIMGGDVSDIWQWCVPVTQQDRHPG
ncbi:D-aminoacid aminotransferase-like PLP-dependent enzyme [Aspergillus niger CBS 101883]|uniref:D-aminoacid aminotransferase-like PLP-dependent enzyme n=1 Tax=Aspergillus lacticoffeatus (strain CBS 101883) TaxID=1450533 RepID=UPI000D7F31CB|nr:D-aminoacid aminotransferase-like PLP-dependent enzyme [Aspergillus niger CBS 101883]PYH55684.1 D-aminoacid aminotransferase-like PLP-dependent enzyme [Aspergillus niger CBS 101883]